MKVLVTGAEGFIGSSLMVDLIKRGFDVDQYEWDPSIGRMPDLDQGYDWVFHLGAISSTTEKDVEKIMAQNYEFSYRLLMECDRLGINLQYASSASVYGDSEFDTELGYSEECQVAPKSPYAWSKYLFDRLVIKSIPHLKIKVYGFRYFNVWGKIEGAADESHKGDQASLWHKWNKPGPHEIFIGSSEISRDFVHVEDLCNIHNIFTELNEPPESGIYNIGTGKPVSIGMLAGAFSEHKKTIFKEVEMPKELESQYQYVTKSNSIKLHKVLKHYTFKNILSDVMGNPAMQNE